MSVSKRIQLIRWGKKGVESDDSTIQSVGPIASNNASNNVSVGPFIWDRLLDEDDVKGSSPAVDVVFVHGLRGHYLKTWSTTDEHGSNIFWPGDFLREDIEEARVISWGYDAMAASAQPGATVSQNSIFGHAGTLLNDLADRRKDVPERPILWVGHSLGGLVIKEAIIRAASSSTHGRDPRLGDLYSSTIGVIFIGTPHRGSPKASLGESAARLTSRLLAAGSNMQVLGNLRPDSHALEKQLHDFVTVSSHIPVVCFYEELKTGRAGLIVPRASAVYDGKMVSFNSIPADHRDMVRFSSRSDIGYTRVLGHIQSIWKSCKEDYRRKEEERADRERQDKEEKLNKQTYRDEETRQYIRRFLAFPQMEDREDRIEEAHSATLNWVFDKSSDPTDKRGNMLSFPEWLSKDDEPTFWISGKAGSGKSTFMKRICRHEETRQRLRVWARKKPLLICHFFLYELGTDLGKCREGMLRSILHQLLSSDQGLQMAKIGYSVFFETPEEIPGGFISDPWSTWRVLRDVFDRILSAMARLDWKLCLFVDGLDEYRNVEKWKRKEYTEADLEMVYEGEEGDDVWGSNVSIMDDHREVLSFFRDLCILYPSTIKLCLSSRELMIFEDGFGRFPRLRMQECTKNDVTRFVGDQISQISLEQDEKDALTDKITSKSCGVFLWVRLVVKSVLDGYACGDTLKRLHDRVDQAPSRLCGPRGLFMKMLEPAIRDPQARLESSRIFKMMNKEFMCRPTAIPAEWILYGLASYENGKDNFDLALQMPFNLDKPVDMTKVRKQARRVLTGRSGSLLECEPPLYRVTYMHYSVHQFITRKTVWQLFPVDDSFEPLLALLSGILIQVKQRSKEMIERNASYKPPEDPTTYDDDKFTSLFFQAMGVARAIDDEKGDHPVYVKLIDELDRTMTEIYGRVPISQSNHCYWPHHSPPQYDNFLLNATHWFLPNYIRAKLRMIHANDEEAVRKSSTKLLRDLIKMRAHFVTILRKPELIQGLEHNHPYGDCWWATDPEAISALVMLGADLEEIWGEYLSLGYAIAFAADPPLDFPVYCPPNILGPWHGVWIATLAEALDLGFNPFRLGKVSCEDWSHTIPLPTKEVSAVDILTIMSERGFNPAYCSFIIEKIMAIDRTSPVSPTYFRTALEEGRELSFQPWKTLPNHSPN